MKTLNSLLGAVIIIFTLCIKTRAQSVPQYTTGIAQNNKGELVMSQKNTKHIDIFTIDGKLVRSYPIDETPTGIVVNDDKAYITTFESVGHLQIMDLNNGNINAKIRVESGAANPTFDSSFNFVYVANQFSNTVSEVNIKSNKVERTVKVLREPKSIVFSQDGRFMFVANYLPQQRADLDYVASCVSVVDTKSFNKVKDIQLANGSNALRDMSLTPDGKYLYVIHNLGRFTVPTSQLQQGWMNTSAFSVIDVNKQEFMGAILVDEPERGAAGVWSIESDDKHVYVAHSGTHDISIIEHAAMINKFEKYPDKSKLDYDLNFLYGIRERINLVGNGPREMLLNDGKLIIPTYFSDTLNIVNIETRNLEAYDLNPGRLESSIDKGEKYFNDAGKCFQNWQSCNGCHPGDARTDGMNWDLMNDGIGNPKNCKSMLLSHVTPKSMISGIRDSAELAVRRGFQLIQFYDIDEESASNVDDYLRSLKPVPSPYLVDGELSAKAKEGKEVFNRLKCNDCHSGPYFTDMKMHRIGDDIEFEDGWDTPTLREVWRTAPYLFDGRAGTMEEVFTIHKHGVGNKKVSKKEIEALTEYVNSL